MSYFCTSKSLREMHENMHCAKISTFTVPKETLQISPKGIIMVIRVKTVYTEISIKINSECLIRVIGKLSLMKKGYNDIEIHKNYTNRLLLVAECEFEWSVNLFWGRYD